MTWDKKDDALPDSHPSEALRFALLKIIRACPEKGEGERLIDALFAYFREPDDSKVRVAENKVAEIKSTLVLARREVVHLEARTAAQAKLLEDSGVREAMIELRLRIEALNYATRK